MHESLHYALAKAHRRGMRAVPAELQPYVESPRARESESLRNERGSRAREPEKRNQLNSLTP
jgi:hypothetical protein